MSAQEVAAKAIRYKPYYGAKGGITVSGGEPLRQPDFVAEIFRLCRESGVHTALDTAGCEPDYAVKRVLQYTDLVLLDIKHCDPVKFKDITGCDINGTLDFLEYITAKGIKFWVRQVIVPGINDNPADMDKLGELLKGRPALGRVELLAYHTLGTDKWKQLGMKYRLEGVAAVDDATITHLNARLREHLTIDRQ